MNLPWDIEQIWRCVLVFFLGRCGGIISLDEKIMMGHQYAAMVGVVASICGIFYDKGNEEYNDEWPKNNR